MRDVKRLVFILLLTPYPSALAESLLPPFPSEAETILDKYKKSAEELKAQTKTRLKEMREQALVEMKALAEKYEKEAKLEEAKALRFRLSLQGKFTPVWNRPSEQDVGKKMILELEGQRDGPVWGTGVYTGDSDLATAAVHAGALRAGERGLVEVEVVPGLRSYEGSEIGEVKSGEWEEFPVSFKVQKAVP